MVTVRVDERQLLELVLCAFQASEVESAFDLSELERMPAPFPDLLQRVRDVYDHWSSLEYPYDVYPSGWEAAVLQR